MLLIVPRRAFCVAREAERKLLRLYQNTFEASNVADKAKGELVRSAMNQDSELVSTVSHASAREG